MYKFAICDDNQHDLKMIKNYLNEFLNRQNIKDFKIDSFSKGKSLLQSSINYDLILLDILLKNENGINVAYQLNRKYGRQHIILISCSTDYYKEGYRVNALRYITKPINKLDFFYDLNHVLKNIIQDQLFLLDEAMPNLKIYYKDISYIEVYGHHSYVHTSTIKREFTKPLKYWEEQLKNFNFIRTHKSFIVNLAHIFEITNSTVILKNQITLPLTRTYRHQVELKFYKFLGDQI